MAERAAKFMFIYAVGMLMISGYITGDGRSVFSVLNLPWFGSRSVSKGTQKIVSFVFGCPGLIPEGSNVTVECRNKRAKPGQNLDCSMKVPLNTQAFFTCPKGQLIEEEFDNIKCIFPGMWDNDIVTCIPDPSFNGTCVAPGNSTATPGLNTTCAASNTTTTTDGNTTVSNTAAPG